MPSRSIKRGLQPSIMNVAPLHQTIDIATAGLQPYLNRMLNAIPPHNSRPIAEYVVAMQSEINPTVRHRKNLVFSLMHFSRFLAHKPFRQVGKTDILRYLDSYRKTDEEDPLHKWIGTYNVRRAGLIKFFRWL